MVQLSCQTPEATATTAAGVTENRDVVMPDVLTVSNGLYRLLHVLCHSSEMPG